MLRNVFGAAQQKERAMCAPCMLNGFLFIFAVIAFIFNGLFGGQLPAA